MARIVALLRGVNIGKRRMAMADLRAGLEAAGCADVATYVQSGNVVCTPPATGRRDPASWLAEAISAVAGFEVGVVVRTAAELDAVVAANPYPQAGGTTLHVVFSAEPVPADLLDGIDLDAVAPEHATVVGREVFLHLPEGMGRAALPTLVERAGGRGAPLATTRNWNTVLKLQAMASG
jgi:uncharacterized protein (DUF1697 family)